MPSSFVSSLSFPFLTHPLHPSVHCFPLQETLLSLLFDFLLVSWLLSIALQLHCFCIFSPSIYCFLVRREQIVFSSSWWSVGAWALLQRISLWSDQNPEMETFLWSIIRNRIDLEMNIPGIYVPRFKIKYYDFKNKKERKKLKTFWLKNPSLPVQEWWPASGHPRWSWRTRWRWSCPCRPPHPRHPRPQLSWSTRTIASCALINNKAYITVICFIDEVF